MGKLIVTIIGCRNLKNTDTFGKSDPYVKLSIGNKKFHTKTVSNSQAPNFNEMFTFFVADPANDILGLKVMDKDTFSDDEIGVTEFSLNNLVKGEKHEEWKALTHKQDLDRGTIGLILVAEDFGRSAELVAPPAPVLATTPTFVNHGSAPPPPQQAPPPLNAPPGGAYPPQPLAGGYPQQPQQGGSYPPPPSQQPGNPPPQQAAPGSYPSPPPQQPNYGGYPSQQPPAQQSAYGAPAQQSAYGAPPQQSAYGAPPQQSAYGAPQSAYGAPPQQAGGYPPQQYPPQQYPPQGGYPPPQQQSGYPPAGPGYPPAQAGGYPPQNQQIGGVSFF